MFELSSIFGKKQNHAYGSIPNDGLSRGGADSSGNANASRIHMTRKVPVKVEPKVYFANERTFLAWMHMSVMLASISIAIVAFADANEWSQFYGLMLMPVSIAFCCYSLYMYTKRARMIRRKEPGPYEEKMGPIVLSVILALSVVINFFVKLYEMNTR